MKHTAIRNNDMELYNRPVYFNMDKPFKTAKRTVSMRFRQELISIRYQNLEGYGLVIMDNDNSENDSEISKVLGVCKNIIKAHSPFAIRDIVKRLEEVLPNYQNFIAGVDVAIYDLLGKILNIPLFKLFGLEKQKLPCSLYSIQNGTTSEMLENVKQHLDWPILKFKMSKLDKDLIRETKRIYDGMLWIDGNGTWDIDLLSNSLEFLVEHNIKVLEQPLPIDHYKLLSTIEKKQDLIIISDEDTVSAEKIIEMSKYIDGVNIKLPKIGGLTNMLDSIICAKKAGLKVVLGCEVGSTIHTTATAQLAGFADFVDVDGHLYINDDCFNGINVDKGTITLPSNIGVGCTKTKYFKG